MPTTTPAIKLSREFLLGMSRAEADANHRNVPHSPLVGVTFVAHEDARYAVRWIEPGGLSKTMSYGVAVTNCETGRRLMVTQVIRKETTRRGVTTVRYSALGAGWNTRADASAGLVALVAPKLAALAFGNPVTGGVLVPVAVGL